MKHEEGEREVSYDAALILEPWRPYFVGSTGIPSDTAKVLFVAGNIGLI
jgi:hypothetical protein